jgi:hypothetical protein
MNMECHGGKILTEKKSEEVDEKPVPLPLCPP